MGKALRQTISARAVAYAAAALLVLIGLYGARLYSYNLFHSAAELFSIVVFFSIFIIAYNARRFLDHNYFLALGAGYGFVAAVDALHMLAEHGQGELYGEERLRTFVRDLGGIRTSRVPALVYEEVMRFAEGKLTDDVALVAVGRGTPRSG